MKGGFSMKAAKGIELILTADNKVGELDEIASGVRDNGINIRAISAWVFEDKAYFRLILSDYKGATKILSQFGQIDEKEVIIVDMPDEVGQLFTLTSRLKENGIDLRYMYGTTSESGKQPAILVFSSNDNDRALEAISS